MAKGGKREGAGRPKGFKALAAEQARAHMAKRIADELDPILDAQIESAKGLHYETKDKKVFTREPDVAAGKYLVDQLVGKAKESVDVTTKGDKIGESDEKVKELTRKLNALYREAGK